MKVKVTTKTLYDFGLYLYFVLTYISDSIPLGNLFLVTALLLMIISKIVSRKSFRFTKMDVFLLIWLVIFALYVCASRFWAVNPSLTRNKSRAMLNIVLFMITIVACKYKDLSVDTILKVIMIGGYTVGLYVFARYGFLGIMTALRNEERIGAVLNSNTVGMCSAYSLLVNLFYLMNGKRRQIIDLLILPILVLLIATGSRKAILILIGGLFLLFILKNFSTKKIVSSLRKIVIITILFSIGLVLVFKLPALSRIADRLNSMFIVLLGGGTRRTDGWLRVQYIRLGLQLFRKNPILGVGLANANIYTKEMWGHDHYLHNNYVELLATLGIVGTIIYYSLYLYCLRIYVKYRSKVKDNCLDICLVILIMKLVMDYGYVSFYGKSTYVYTLLFWIETGMLIRRYKQERKQLNPLVLQNKTPSKEGAL